MTYYELARLVYESTMSYRGTPPIDFTDLDDFVQQWWLNEVDKALKNAGPAKNDSPEEYTMVKSLVSYYRADLEGSTEMTFDELAREVALACRSYRDIPEEIHYTWESLGSVGRNAWRTVVRDLLNPAVRSTNYTAPEVTMAKALISAHKHELKDLKGRDE